MWGLRRAGRQALIIVDSTRQAEQPPSTAANPCPKPTLETQLLQHDVYGYCFLYPTEYEVIRLATAYPSRFGAPPTTLVTVSGSLLTSRMRAGARSKSHRTIPGRLHAAGHSVTVTTRSPYGR
ncbi:MAG: hypothetical protein R2911_44120 [Caldilineaceae bacterium]